MAESDRICAVLSEEDVVIFKGQAHFLGAMYESSFIADGEEFPSVEHFYQFWKILSVAGRDAAERFKATKAPMTEIKRIVRSMLKEYAVTRRTADEWRKNHGASVLYYANALKFTQHKELAKKLFQTENRLIVQAFPREEFFSAGLDPRDVMEWIAANEGVRVEFSFDIHDHNLLKTSDKIGNGYNVLGIVIMKLREALKKFYETGATEDKYLQTIFA